MRKGQVLNKKSPVHFFAAFPQVLKRLSKDLSTLEVNKTAFCLQKKERSKKDNAANGFAGKTRPEDFRGF